MLWAGRNVWAEGNPHREGALPLTQCQWGSPPLGLGWWMRRPSCLWVNQAQPRACSWDLGVTSVHGAPWAGYQSLVLGLQKSCAQLIESSQMPPRASVQIPTNACCLSHEQGPVFAVGGPAGFCLPSVWPLVLSRYWGGGGRGLGLSFFWPEHSFHTGLC